MAKQLHRTLVSWIGGNDLMGIANKPSGPILSTLKNTEFDSVQLLYSYPQAEVEPYLTWLQRQVHIPIKATEAKLSSPVNSFGLCFWICLVIR